MATIFDDLDPTQLELAVTAQLIAALESRGGRVTHQGTPHQHAGAGLPDIVVEFDTRFLLHVEVTKDRATAADREYNPITTHLTEAIKVNGRKYAGYGCLYISPATHARMNERLNSDFNRSRAQSGEPGRVLALDFAGAQRFLQALIEADDADVPAEGLFSAFERWSLARDDARTLHLLLSETFGSSSPLATGLEDEMKELDAGREQELRKDIKKLEDHLRDTGITAHHANQTLVYLTFMRLYEERKSRLDGSSNRMTKAGFTEWTDWIEQNQRTVAAKCRGRMVQHLLEEIAADQDLSAAGLLRRGGEVDTLHEKLRDDWFVKHVLDNVFDRYDFSGSMIDVLGVVFETLAGRAEKDTRVGQFFTPREVVDFCVSMAGLRSTDTILDPAVGTGRFLISGMSSMIAQAGDDQDAHAHIKSRQLLGSDIDGWVSTIAKMNMYIHGDGKSNIVTANGLVLGDAPAFPRYPTGIDGHVDVVLTNPPLGDTSYRVAADHWAELRKDEPTQVDRDEYLRRLGVVPLTDERTRRSAELARLDAKIAYWQAECTTRSGSRLKSAQKSLQNWMTKKAALATTPLPAATPTGEKMKGGALFLGAIANYLKDDRDVTAPAEWRGGRAVVVLDEAVLNTMDMGWVREYIRAHFFIKASVSLGREAFKYLANTDAKTSILFLVRKSKTTQRQTEPVFFAHAEQVGFDAKGRWVGNDLEEVLVGWHQHLNLVEQTRLANGQHDRTAFSDLIDAFENEAWHSTYLEDDAASRLDFFRAHYRVLTARMRAAQATIPLGELVELRTGAAPDPDPKNEYEIGYVERMTARVRSKGIQRYASYKPSQMWLLEAGDIVVPRYDLVHGSVAAADDATAGLVMSPSYYALRVRPGAADRLLPEYAVLLLRSLMGRELVYGLSSGTSNRADVYPDDLLQLPIPPLPPVEDQQRYAAEMCEAAEALARAHALLSSATDGAARSWPAVGQRALVALAGLEGDGPADEEADGSPAGVGYSTAGSCVVELD